ncbi:GRAM domain-containing protein, partial [Paraphysoderma sedebokerense]
VAKQSKNQQFHSIFRSVPDQEFLIEDFSCALQKEILVQGRLYVSENHICFHASILGWITTVMVPFSDVIAIEKRVTALIFPNAIEVITERQKYFFASFIFRELAFNLLTSLWRKANP